MTNLSREEKKRLIKKHSPKSRHIKNMSLAFLVGGFLCFLAEGERQLLLYFGLDEKLSLTVVSLTFIFIGATLTAFGVFDNIARRAGAGTLVPITGFSNSIVSEAIDSKSEGIILGVGSKIFTVAGPVILYGSCAGIIYGLIYYSVTTIVPLLQGM